MQVCIFEDSKYPDFYPISYSRPVYDLICGARSLKEKIISDFPNTEISLHCRSHLQDVTERNNPGCKVNEINGTKCFFINGRILNNGELKKLFNDNKKDCIYKNGEEIIVANLSGKNLEKIKKNIPHILDFKNLTNLPVVETDIKTVKYTWDLISENGNQIIYDIDHLKRKKKSKKSLKGFTGVHFVKPGKIYLGKKVTIKPGVVIDATHGPVLIDDNAYIFPNAVIEGPVYIGKNSKIKSGATIYENVSIGDTCKIGGEVEDAIIMSYSNKQHAGFIGHAYLGSWVNLGADTNCSDLKNNYSTIRVDLNGKSIDTGLQFLGLIIGDHSKTAINTMLNTGTIAGFSSNIFGAGFPDKFIPSFSWGGSEGFSTYDLEKGIETVKIVMMRRDIDFLPEDEKLFKYIFDLTENERKK